MIIPWAAFAFLLLVAVAMYAGRHELARFQAFIVGGRMQAGCVIAEIVAIVVLAFVVLLFGRAVL